MKQDKSNVVHNFRELGTLFNATQPNAGQILTNQLLDPSENQTLLGKIDSKSNRNAPEKRPDLRLIHGSIF